MTKKYKISDLAKDFGMPSKEIASLASELTGTAK